MLICSKCGSTSPDGTKFCQNCGASLGTQKKAGCLSGCAVVVLIFVFVCMLLAMCSRKDSETVPEQTTKAAETSNVQTDNANELGSGSKTSNNRSQKNGFDEQTNKTVVIGSYQIKIPTYLQNGSYQNSKKTYVAEAESGEKTVLFLFGYTPGSYSTYDSLNANKETLINNLKNANNVLGVETGGVRFSDYNSKLGKGIMAEFASNDTINGARVLFYNRYVFIPVKEGCLVFMFEQSNQAEWNYTNDLERIINSAEKKKSTPTKKPKTKKKSTKKSTNKKSSKKSAKKSK